MKDPVKHPYSNFTKSSSISATNQGLPTATPSTANTATTSAISSNESSISGMIIKLMS